METIQANHLDFKHRLFISSGFFLGLIMFIILEILILNKWGLKLDYSLIFQVILIVLFLLFFYISNNKSKYYIDKIEFNEKSILLSVYRYDKRIENIEIYYSELIAYLKKNFYEKYPRYTLELKSRNPIPQMRNEFSIKQYEIGFWNKENLKNVYNRICQKQQK